MIFSSYVFLFGFLPLTLVGFLLFSTVSHRASKLWLCAASLVFYGWWDTRWLPVLLASIVVNYLFGLRLIRRAPAERATRPTLFLAIAVNIGALVYYKYIGGIFAVLGVPALVPLAQGLPLGISFFTFTQIAFLVDVSQGFHERYTPINYLLFVTFFPHLIAGPIVHHRDLMPQFEEERNYRFQPDEFAVGLAIFAIGLAKKALIADQAATIAARLLDQGPVGPSAAWIGVLSYSMQLYFDFSGYSDMAIGLARMFGIKFPINFDSPYKATSIIEFWQCWHITLTRFLTAYLYNPIALALVRRRAQAGKSTSKRVSQTPAGFLELIALPTTTTLVLAGIWHGAGLQFIIFGALHSTYVSINHAWRTFGPRERELSPMPALLRRIGYGVLVYLAVLLAQVFFRAESTHAALRVLGEMAGAGRLAGPAAGQQVAALDVAVLLGSMAVAWLAPNTQQIMARFEPAIMLGHKLGGSPVLARFDLRWAAAFGILLFIGLFSIREGQPFIYFQF